VPFTGGAGRHFPERTDANDIDATHARDTRVFSPKRVSRDGRAGLPAGHASATASSLADAETFTVGTV
jgi:hypothetical protein